MIEERIKQVTRTNEAFYEAFQTLDIAQMDKVWAQKEYVTCIHPGWTLRSGWPEVRDSWVLIFNNTFSMEFELTDLQVQVAGDLGWVVCMERIVSRQGEAEQRSRILATNLYERLDGEWRIIHHHGSPGMG